MGMGGESYGPIPWTAIAEYGRVCFSFSGADLTAFVRVIREMDQEELEHISREVAAQQKAKAQQQPPRGASRRGRR